MTTEKHLIFDFDGVLVDSFEFHFTNITQIFDIDMTREAFRDIHKGNFFDHVEQSPLKGLDWLYYRDTVYETQRTLPMLQSMKDVLVQFSNNCTLSVISSGSEKTIADFFSHHAVEHFRDILGLESHHTKTEKFALLAQKHAFHPENALFVTDTSGDIMEAHASDISSIGVTWGYHDHAELASSNPFAIATTPAELKEAVERFYESS